MTIGSLPSESGVGRVALTVTDPDRMAEFYESVVGLSVISNGPNRRSLGVGETALLELISTPDAPERPRTATGLFHHAIRVPSRAALGAALARIEASWQLDGASDHLVSEALYLSDPEDNGVEIYQDRPRADWPIDEHGRVGMTTLPLDLADVRGAINDTRPDRVPPDTTMGHVHLEVSSIADARAFYVDGIGLGVRQTYGDSALFLAAGEYHHHVGVNAWNARRDPPAGRGLAWFELLVPTDDALSAARDRLVSGGWDPTPIERGISVEDPDGIVVRLRRR